jgi:hypothetical protein
MKSSKSKKSSFLSDSTFKIIEYTRGKDLIRTKEITDFINKIYKNHDSTIVGTKLAYLAKIGVLKKKERGIYKVVKKLPKKYAEVFA